ncbi:hypothetical protein [Paucisalibacillus globulus]|uniref:hypothetical protein n=1 Tax=Paucisalibacillus globulus TaxID=351095 RepID=UPI0004214147|nr:hypothetical protein [Paucisalibacillus globulus]
MNRGTAQMISPGEVDKIAQSAKTKMEQGLLAIEAINQAFIRQAKAVSESGFSGEFRNAFSEKTDKELELIQVLDADNLERIRQMIINFEDLLSDISYQDYVYETELIPAVKK